jgi:hypothetical protein
MHRLKIMLKKAYSSAAAIPSAHWFEFVTGLSEPHFIARRAEVIQPHPHHSAPLHGIDIGPSLQIWLVHCFHLSRNPPKHLIRGAATS